MGSIGIPEIVALFMVGLVAVPFCLISKKAGYSPWFGILFLVPVAGVFAVLFFALSKWPIEKKLESIEGS